MIRKHSIWLSLPILIGLSGAGLCQDNAAGQPGGKTSPIPDVAGRSCRTIAAILVVYPALEVRRSDGTVRDHRNGAERSGCRVRASGPASGMAGEVPPDEPIRFLLGESGWEQDHSYEGDGPGTTSFALRKNGVLCLFSGGTSSRIEDGKVRTAETYEFEAWCVEKIYRVR